MTQSVQPAPSRTGPDRYIATEELRGAIEVARILGKPLLVSGETGSGKTRLAEYVLYYLRSKGEKIEGDVLGFETKSTSDGRDLFYSYNSLARFHAAQMASVEQRSGVEPNPVKATPKEIRSADYIQYKALGEAFLRSWPYETVSHLLAPGTERWLEAGPSVVLIDEIDKAPHDFPNDILNEIEYRFFRIPELENGNVQVKCHEKHPPFVVLTSNEEKGLPDPFLRRCVYYHIPKITPEHARNIACSRIAVLANRANAPLLTDAVKFFFELRGESETRQYGLDRKPGAAELLDWLVALGGLGVGPEERLASHPDQARNSLVALVKGGPKDVERAGAALERLMPKAPGT